MQEITWYPHCKLPEYEPSTYLSEIAPFVDETEEYNQVNDEVQKFYIERQPNGTLTATDFFNNERYTVARFYERNILSQEFLSRLRWDGRQLTLVDRKDVREYFSK